MCLRRAPEKYIAGAALDRAALAGQFTDCATTAHFCKPDNHRNFAYRRWNSRLYTAVEQGCTYTYIEALLTVFKSVVMVICCRYKFKVKKVTPPFPIFLTSLYSSIDAQQPKLTCRKSPFITYTPNGKSVAYCNAICVPLRHTFLVR
jgi:hypothetical protein